MRPTAAGSPRIYPPLPGNANLQSADPSSILRIILDGAQTVTTPRAPNTGSMPAYAANSRIRRSPMSRPISAIPGAMPRRR